MSAELLARLNAKCTVSTTDDALEISASEIARLDLHSEASTQCACNARKYKSGCESFWICSACGCEDKILNSETISYQSMESYNTSSTSSAPIKIIGPRGYYYSRRLMKRSTDYGKTQMRDTLNQMETIVKRYKGQRVSSAIVRDAAQFYYEIQQLGEIKRGNVRRGTMCACLNRICEYNGIARKRAVLCDMFDINSRDLSNGEKSLEILCQEYNLRSDRLGTPAEREKDRIRSFLQSYFQTLEIPDMWFEFAEQVIWFAIKFRVSSSSNPNSKSAGAVWLILQHTRIRKMTARDVEQVCKISSSTFKRFSQSIEDILYSRDFQRARLRRKLRHLFHKFNINI